MTVRAHVIVHGRVQGVYYRSYAVDEAKALGIKGWISNIEGGLVEAVFEGEEEAARKMIDWCWQGSPSSMVTNVEVEWGEATGEFLDFVVSYRYRKDG
jgi:acylphosphatase